jgi:hypothetical protein
MFDSTNVQSKTEATQQTLAVTAANPSEEDSSTMRSISLVGDERALSASTAVKMTQVPNSEGGAIIAPEDLLAHARSMTDDELGDHIRRESKVLCTKLVQLEPFIRVAFERIDSGNAICGHKSKKAFCSAVVGRSYNAVKFMLYGGNPRNKQERKPKPLTDLEFKLLGTATNVHEALIDLKANRIDEAVSKLNQKLPTQDRIDEYLERGVAPTVLNPSGIATLGAVDVTTPASNPVAKTGAAAECDEELQVDDDEDLYTLLKVQLEELQSVLANEPDRGVASRLLTEYLASVASQFTSSKIEIGRVSATVTFKGRSHRIMPGDLLSWRHTTGSPAVLCKCTAVTESTDRRKVRDWSDGAWQKERVIYNTDESQYRVISGEAARALAPEAFASPAKRNSREVIERTSAAVPEKPIQQANVPKLNSGGSKLVYQSLRGDPKVLEVAVPAESRCDPPTLKYFVCQGEKSDPFSTMKSAIEECNRRADRGEITELPC